jgi:hypothetical protein
MKESFEDNHERNYEFGLTSRVKQEIYQVAGGETFGVDNHGPYLV